MIIIKSVLRVWKHSFTVKKLNEIKLWNTLKEREEKIGL